MKALSATWFLEKTDFEYNQYVLLAYIQKVKEEFRQYKLEHFLNEVKYHAKNVECFSTTRQILETKERPLSEEQLALAKEMLSLPDSDPRNAEMMNTAKWATKELQKVLKQGSAIWRKIESDLNVFYVEKIVDRYSGYLVIRYVGSPIVEIFKMEYKPRSQEVSFKLVGYRESVNNDLSDISKDLITESGEPEAMIIEVTSEKAYNTKEAVLPILKNLLATKVFNKGAIWKL
jgi:hypothetical protein